MQASAFRSSGQKRKMQHKGISFQMALGLGVHGLGVRGFGVHGLGVHGLGALGLGCTASGRTALGHSALGRVCRHTRALPLPLVSQLAALSHVSLLPEHLGLQEIKERAPIHMRRLQKKDGGVWFRSCI